MKKSELFPCYSIPLKDYLISNGFKYELVGLSPTTHNMFWVFIKTEELRLALELWEKNK